MSKNFLEAVKHRRSYYSITNESPVSDTEIENIISTVVKYGPSAFNSQSARVVLLLGDKHRRFWEIVKDVLKAQIGEERFPATGEKIDRMFASGYGTVLFYEDWSVVEAIWTALEEAGFGASLQHYNPIIDEAVAKEFNIPDSWHLNAQMPFGKPKSEAGEKTFKPLEERVRVLR